ncbi:sigma-54-dependent Fis family transcriptional regulator [Rhodococcus zopfii]|uniref:sigma-54-dependent Fis family transcriptional regulator n=1 Tax=Rhodococcus zopfii TaxID=43772 RepID=UPI001F1017C1|nr:helix-turn-helix domain-containing protein [Rhodococcus zopfii]
MSLSVALSDEHARVLVRRDNDPVLAAKLDKVYFAPGFTYAEELVGTNGVGTALETGMAVYVDGAQHYHESIQYFTCAGAPIHNPTTGRVEGLIDITGLTHTSNPLMRQLALGAARDIESALRATGSIKQQLVLGEFLVACRRRQTAVYSLSCGVFMSNEIGSRLLDPIDEAFLREEAQSMLDPSRVAQFDLRLPSGGSITVKRTLVEHGGDIAGIVLEVEATSCPTKTVQPRRTVPVFPGVAGSSLQWNRCRGELTSLAATDANVILKGEPGSGKLTLVRGMHLYKNPQAPIVVVDCSAGKSAHEELRTALDSAATTIVLRRIDQLDASTDELFADLMSADQHRYPARWIVATISTDGDALQNSALAEHFIATVEVPALRHHPDDIPDIIRMHLAPHRESALSDDAMRTLKKYHWPGNVRELVDTLKQILRAKPAGTIAAADLPSALSSAPRRTMSAMERAERDAIVAALRDSGGNRVAAAKLLGIARSSLYRKIDTFGIHV